MISRVVRLGVLLAMLVAFCCSIVSVAAAPAVQSGDLTILFNADTRPQIPILTFPVFPHEGLFMTCSGLGAESTVFLQLFVDRAFVQQENCDGTIEVHGLAGHEVEISAVDSLGVGPVFHLIAYGTDIAAPTGTPTAGPLPFGCTYPDSVFFSRSYELVLAGRFTWADGGGGFPFTTGGTALPLSLDDPTITDVTLQVRNNINGVNPFAPVAQIYDTGVLVEWWGFGAGFPASVRHEFVSPGPIDITLYNTPGFGTMTSDLCVFVGRALAPTPTPGTPTVTSTPSPTSTALPTPLPTYGNCITVSSSNVPGNNLITGSGDFYGRFWRIHERGQASVAFRAYQGSIFTTVNIVDYQWRQLTVHTTSVEWRSVTPFSIDICAPVPVGLPTVTPTINVFATPTNTRTQTPTRTATSTPGPTDTALPTATLPITCGTPGAEDTAECAILELLKTPPVIHTPIPVETPLPNITTAVAIICERDPCASAGAVGGALGSIIDELQANANAPACGDFQWETGFGGGSLFQLDAAEFAKGFCYMMDLTTPFRFWLRLLSVFFAAALAVSYYMKTMRRVGDV